MFTITVEGHFSSAHNLRGYRGKCEELHGHNWKVAVNARKDKLDKTGMVIDFQMLRKGLKSVLAALDHTYINKIPYFARINPTSEQIAHYIYDQLKKKFPEVSSVTVWENHGSSATYGGQES
ncbi:MAG: 6-carboxytetrahydropterin synthase QueD [Candidatus Omnitrophica bacterium]|nr:6-carboxytetrahydropterin synthase QueD [Candidatus Omnitrophota bacterium]